MNRWIQTERAPLLNTALDWRMLADISRQLQFHDHIFQTQLRLDAIRFLNATEQVDPVELTIPRKEIFGLAHESKFAKYYEVLSSAESDDNEFTVGRLKLDFEHL